MIIWSALLLGCFAQDVDTDELFEDLYAEAIVADTSFEAALGLCLRFYDGGAIVTVLGAGAQSVVYKCSSGDRNATVADVALKMYKTPISV